jgi:hypothetical protein
MHGKLPLSQKAQSVKGSRNDTEDHRNNMHDRVSAAQRRPLRSECFAATPSCAAHHAERARGPILAAALLRLTPVGHASGLVTVPSRATILALIDPPSR